MRGGGPASGEALEAVDPTRLRLIVGNLLDNAIRHGPEGGAVTVGMWIDDGALVLEVPTKARGSHPRSCHTRSPRRTRGPTLVRNRPESGAEVVVTLPLS